ncbi:MAG: ribose-phosphate pyrophosphokinase [Peptococcaceae bacterium]|nr:ribose-phosphate pyrophosphokinase [Peptococcaceae bacterium]
MTTEKKIGNLKLFTGNANPELAQEIAEYIGTKVGDAQVKHFSDGEISIMIDESVRGDDVYIIQPTCTPVNDNMMELLIMIDAMRRASAKRITAVLPYYGYARQDRKSRGREPITAKLVANLIDKAGARRVLAMDLHAQQIQGFFDIPLDNLMGLPILADYYKHKDTENLVVVSPDMGGVARARNLAEQIGVPLAIIDKRRPRPNVSEVMNIIGDIEGKEVILVDDMIDTAGTITNGAQALMDRGAKCVDACCTHAVLSGPAIERIEKSPIQELVTTNTIPLGDKKCDKIKVLSVAPIIGEAILRIHNDRSVSDLFR